MKGIILAGGKGTRLYPITKSVSKQLLPIYDKPMIYYPLSVLLLAKIREILIITTKEDIQAYMHLLGNGEDLGVRIEYKIQEQPRGIGEAFILGENFINEDSVCLVLGDNIFFGQDLTDRLEDAKRNVKGATIFGYPVNNPKEFGVITFNSNGKVIDIEEKPMAPKSNYAVPGLYFYDNKVVSIAKNIQPSSRGELEITEINKVYLTNNELNIVLLGRGMAWLDTGTPNAMLKASEFVEAVQNRQGFYISCIEEIAWRRGFISSDELLELGNKIRMTDYGKYIMSLVESHS